MKSLKQPWWLTKRNTKFQHEAELYSIVYYTVLYIEINDYHFRFGLTMQFRSELQTVRPVTWKWTDLKSAYGGLRQAVVSYRSWVDFLCIIQSDEKSNKSELYITDVFELNSCVFFCLLKDKRLFFGLPLKGLYLLELFERVIPPELFWG